jgi:hypothetical protein
MLRQLFGGRSRWRGELTDRTGVATRGLSRADAEALRERPTDATMAIAIPKPLKDSEARLDRQCVVVYSTPMNHGALGFRVQDVRTHYSGNPNHHVRGRNPLCYLPIGQCRQRGHLTSHTTTGD